MNAHVLWRNGASLCGETGACLSYVNWTGHKYFADRQCKKCKNHPDLGLLILEYLP